MDSSGTRHEISAGAAGSFNRNGQNIENMMELFNVDSADKLPALPDNGMVVIENVSAIPIASGFSYVRGRSIVMDENKYCEYVFLGISYGIGFPFDRYDTVGYVYGVKDVGDYNGLFLSGSVNVISDIQGGAVAPNGVSAKIIGGHGFISATAGTSITYYKALSDSWIYEKANINFYVSPYSFVRYDPSGANPML